MGATQKKFTRYLKENNILSIWIIDDINNDDFDTEFGRCDVLMTWGSLYNCRATTTDGFEFDLQVDTHAYCAYLNDDWSAYD